MWHKLSMVFLFSVLSVPAYSQQDRERWVDSVFNTLSRQEKAAQLFFVFTPSNPSEDEYDDLEDFVEDGIGGIVITHGGPLSHAKLVNKLQEFAPSRLLVGASAEWGIRQTLDSVDAFQKPMVAGAVSSDSLVGMWSRAMARQMKTLGFHINFAPNIDDEIFAGDYLRYFGDNKKRNGERTSAFVRSMQEEGVMTVAKHLPRHRSDERALPDSMVVLNLNRIDAQTLEPLQQLIAEKVAGISTDYLHFSIENAQGIVPGSVSQVFVSEVLKKKLGFQGIVFSDARSIRQRLGKVRSGDAELLAFQSGADAILNPVDVSAGIRKIASAARKNVGLQKQLDSSVRKILAAKYDAGLHQYLPVNTDNLFRRLNNPEYRRVNEAVAASAVTVIQQTDSLLPVRLIEGTTFVSVAIGRESGNAFDKVLKKYAPIRTHSIQHVQDTAVLRFSPDEFLIVSIFPYANVLEQELKLWIERLAAGGRVVVVHFGHPASLTAYSYADAVIAAYTEHDHMPSVAAQVIFGALPATGELPLTAGPWSNGTSVETKPLGRLSYAVPEAAGLNSRMLEKIKIIMEEAVASKGTPGCYAMVARDGKIVYEQSVGWLTYDMQQPVNEETIYDLASMTKVLGMVPTMMFLYERGIIDIHKKASVYLPELRGTNKEDLTIIDILTHQAGLLPFIPVWPKTMINNSQYDSLYYSSTRSEKHPYQVAPELFGSVHLKDSSWKWMLQTNLLEKPPRTPYTLRYSDLGPWILYRLAERLLNQPIHEFLQQNFYDPIGAGTTGYLPLDRFDRAQIAPTEIDTEFRKGLVVGTVHDERAAVLGGVAGHAGLFSNAGDVAKLGQMLLQKGYYGGYQYFKPETIELFTRKQFKPSRRGLGWDKPLQSEWNSPTSRYASPQTYGHTGFTGTCIWVDPEFDLVFVFLSNRVHPGRNSSFNSANIRTRIQEVIYQSMFTYCADK